MKNKNNDLLAIYLITGKINLDFERPIFIDGFPTDYTITRNGDVYSYKCYGTDKPRKLKHSKSKTGYHQVTLSINNKEKVYKVYRLVAKAFIPNPYNKPEVNHKDGNKDHNYESNLEWSTSKENIAHAYKHSLRKGMKGSKHPKSTITEKEVILIAEMLISDKYTYQEIADIMNVSYTIVKKIKTKERWKHVTEKYDFSNYTPSSKRRN